MQRGRTSLGRIAVPLAAALLTLVWARLARAEKGSHDAAATQDLPSARVRAVRMAELPEDPSSFVSVIETEAYRGEGKTAPDILSDSVGVQVRRFGGPGQLSEISIRGSTGRQVVILLDGVRLNNAQTGSVDLSTIPIELVDRIEVSRGSGSVQVGSDAVGGVVNIITKQPTDDPTTSATLKGGSFGTWEGAISHTQRNGVQGISAGYQGFHTEGDWDFQTAEIQSDVGTLPSRELERVNNDATSHSSLLRWSRRHGENVRVGFTNNAYYLSRGRPGLDARQREHARERRLRNVVDAKLDWEDLFEGRVQVEGRTYYRYERVDFHDREPPPPEQPIDSLDHNHVFGLRGGGEGEASLGWSEHLGAFHLDLRRDGLDSRNFGNQERWVVGFSIQDEIAVLDERLLLVPGFRFDWTEGFDSEALPRFGYVLSPWPWLRIKGNVERAYRVPSFEELYFDLGSIRGNPNLKPEKAVNWDVGAELGIAEWGPLSGLSLEVAYFDNDIDNSIVFQLVSPDVVQATNTGDAEIEGVEVSGGLTFWKWLRASGNYTWQDARNEPGEFEAEIGGGGTALPGRAEHEWSFRLRLGPPSGLFKLVAEQHHTSKIPLRFSGRTYVSARTTYDASLAVDVAQLMPGRPDWGPGELLVSVSGQNLTDRSVRDALGFPQPGRMLTFGGEVRW